jgi:hypothetical protein
MTEDEIRQFQQSHDDWEGKQLVVDGVLGPRTRWAVAISRLDPRRQAIVANACGFVGLVEHGTNRGTEIDTWLERCGAPLGSPWCAAFASWCISVPGLPSVREAGAQALGRALRPSTIILPGDVMWFATGAWQGHCGIVIGTGPGELAAVEGNHQNRVAIVRREMRSVRVVTPLPVEELADIPPGLPLVPVRAEGTR